MRKIERKIKNKKITIIILTKNNDIYNTGIVTAMVKLFMYLWIKYWEQEE